MPKLTHVFLKTKFTKETFVDGDYATLIDVFKPCIDGMVSYPRLDTLSLRTLDLVQAERENPDFLRDIPCVPNLDAKILAAIDSGQGILDMGEWHGACGTAHCVAGFAVAFAGEAGRALERRLDVEFAGALIYWRSMGYIPDFFTSNGIALANMRRRVQAEKKKQEQDACAAS